jgi:hypothetical protein
MKGLSQLVGLGVGSTPGGDDFISGVLLGEKILNLLYGSQMELFDVGQQGSGPCSINKEEIWNRLVKTSFVGKTLLWQALQGHFPSYLIEAVRGLAAAGGLENMKKTVARAASHGETSGTDALVGLSLYLDWVARWHVLAARSVD